jgi:hypothetical protein
MGVAAVAILLVLLAVALLPAAASAATINVPANQPTINGAIAAALAGDTILVAPGTYTDTEAADDSQAAEAAAETDADTESAGDTSTSKPVTAAEKKMLKRVHLAGVSIGADGHYIVVRFTAPPRLADSWRGAPMSVTDEETGTAYDQIPTMPLVGLLYAPPHTDGQVGYVTFVNNPRLPTGARLTVALGDFVEKHVAVQGGGDE